MSKKDLIVNIENISDYIYIIRGQKVMLDEDLATLYGVETKKLNQTVKRNIDRFPKEFMFQLSNLEIKNLKSQFVTSSSWGGRRKLPYVFTEHGVAMLSGVLRSKQAIKINIEIIKTFIKLRHILSEHKDLSKKVEELQSFVLKNSHTNDKEFKKIWNIIKKLMIPEKNERKIGFDLSK